MDIQEFYMRRIYNAFTLPVIQLNKEGILTAKAGPLEALPDAADIPDITIPESAYPKDVSPDMTYAERIRRLSRSLSLPVIVLEGSRIIYMGFEEKAGTLYLLGPASLGRLSLEDQHAYKLQHGLAEMNLPSVTLQQALSSLSLLYAAITGDMVPEKQIIEHSLPEMSWEVNQPENDRKQAAWYLDMFDKDMKFSTYQDEQNFLSEFSQGEMWIPDEVIVHDLWQMESVGPLSRDNFYKQSEYAVVTAAALMRSEAIRAGVSWEEAYRVFNHAIQDLVKASSALETMFVYRDVVNQLSALIRKTKVQPMPGSLPEQCKDYIANHIRRNFTIQEMADEMGYSPGYLSHIFSESEGVTLQQYIIREKLTLASNLLINTNEKIGIISDYLGFHSQSYMTEQFSKQYGMTPTQYRKQHRSQKG